MSLAASARLGPYEIVAPIGAGGMGEVYRARDTRLDRQVALKVSQHEFTDRFEREARTISALNKIGFSRTAVASITPTPFHCTPAHR